MLWLHRVCKHIDGYHKTDEHFLIKLILIIFHHNTTSLFDSVHHIISSMAGFLHDGTVVNLPLFLYPFTFYMVHMSHTANICRHSVRSIADRRCPQLPNPCYVDISVYLYSPFVQHMSLSSPSLTPAYIQNQWSPTAMIYHLSCMDTR